MVSPAAPVKVQVTGPALPPLALVAVSWTVFPGSTFGLAGLIARTAGGLRIWNAGKALVASRTSKDLCWPSKSTSSPALSCSDGTTDKYAPPGGGDRLTVPVKIASPWIFGPPAS